MNGSSKSTVAFFLFVGATTSWAATEITRDQSMRPPSYAGGAVTEKLLRTLENAAALAEEADVTVLIETVGIFADTEKLRDVLNRFASDHLAVLWDFQHPYRVCGESPDRTRQDRPKPPSRRPHRPRRPPCGNPAAS